MKANKYEILIEDYKAAIQLTYHIDELRNKLTSHFMSFAGIVSGLLFIIIKTPILNKTIDVDKTAFWICMFVSTVAYIIILINGKLRNVQLEHFEIINGIRSFLIEEHINAKRNLVNRAILLNKKTLPKARFFSGSYLWILIIYFTGSVIIGVGANYLLDSIILSIGIGVFYSIICHNSYIQLSKFPNTKQKENIEDLDEKIKEDGSETV